jgi:hypothetical protein
MGESPFKMLFARIPGMNKMTAYMGAALLFAVSTAAAAAPGYNYVDIAYANADRSGQPARTGYAAGGVFSFSERVHYMLGYANVNNSVRDSTVALLMMGYNMEISDRSDFIARAGWAWEGSRTGANPRQNEDGIAASIGIRTWFSDNFELTGMLNYHNTFRSRASLGAEGVYFFTEHLGIVGSLEIGDDARVARIGMRFSFDGF